MRIDNVVSIDDFSKDDLVGIVKGALEMKKRDKEGERFLDILNEKVLASLFYEPSTRTRTSFETAMRELGGVVTGFSGTEGTSVKKKEALWATLKMYEANHADAIIMRHPRDGSLQWAADVSNVPVINGGDGKNEHPTQAMLDLVTMWELNEGIDGLNIGFGGDLAHGRTVHSNVMALSKFDNVTVHWAAPKELGMPGYLIGVGERRGLSFERYESVDEVLRSCNVYYMTRPQIERMEMDENEVYKMLEEYKITLDRIPKEAKIMHPLPVDSEVAEVDFEVAASDRQYFLSQAENGIFLRKFLLYSILSERGSAVYRGEMDESVLEGNNRVYLETGEDDKEEGEVIRDIKNGCVIDHIEDGQGESLAEELQLNKYTGSGLATVKSTRYGRKQIIKIPIVPDTRQMKMALMKSPNVTFNEIGGGEVVAKYKGIVCGNDNCISRDVNEDVPAKFYLDEEEVRCRYCRTSHSLDGLDVDNSDLEKFCEGLPREV